MTKSVTLDDIIEELERTLDTTNYQSKGKYHDLSELLYDLKKLKQTTMPQELTIPIVIAGKTISFVPFQPNPKRAFTCLYHEDGLEIKKFPVYVSKQTHRMIMSEEHIDEWVPAVTIGRDKQARYIGCKIVGLVDEEVTLSTTPEQLSLTLLVPDHD